MRLIPFSKKKTIFSYKKWLTQVDERDSSDIKIKLVKWKLPGNSLVVSAKIVVLGLQTCM